MTDKGKLEFEYSTLRKAFAHAVRIISDTSYCPKLECGFELEECPANAETCQNEKKWMCWQQFMLYIAVNHSVCRVCGCTDDHACEDICYWVQEDLCSSCASGAVFDPTGQYRYLLTRLWDETRPTAVFVMLNPSTADAENDDPTIRRCMDFANRWGYGSIKVVNVFAYRATDPKELLKVEDPVGPENHEHIKRALLSVGFAVAAWGSAGPKDPAPYKCIFDITKEVGVPLHCLGTTKDKKPRHPLYVKSATKPSPIIRIGADT